MLIAALRIFFIVVLFVILITVVWSCVGRNFEIFVLLSCVTWHLKTVYWSCVNRYFNIRAVLVVTLLSSVFELC